MNRPLLVGRCCVTDLPRIMCHHCDPTPRMPASGSPPVLFVRDRRTGSAVPIDHPGRINPREVPNVADWNVERPETVVCDHGHDDSTWLCRQCADDLKATLTDVPQLWAELEVTYTKQDAFLDTGQDRQADPDESPVAWNQAAAKARVELTYLLDGDPPSQARLWVEHLPDVLRRKDIKSVAARLTSTVAYARKVIDRRETPFDYGPCPLCHETILQERITEGATDKTVRCLKCGNYEVPLDVHQRTQVMAGIDEWRTYSEIREMLHIIGEPIAKHTLDNLINRQGLYREARSVPKWQGGQLVAVEQWHYRLSDVRQARRDRFRADPVMAPVDPDEFGADGHRHEWAPVDERRKKCIRCDEIRENSGNDTPHGDDA